MKLSLQSLHGAADGIVMVYLHYEGATSEDCEN